MSQDKETAIPCQRGRRSRSKRKGLLEEKDACPRGSDELQFEKNGKKKSMCRESFTERDWIGGVNSQINHPTGGEKEGAEKGHEEGPPEKGRLNRKKKQSFRAARKILFCQDRGT